MPPRPCRQCRANLRPKRPPQTVVVTSMTHFRSYRRQLCDLIEPCIVVRGRIDSEPIPDPDGLVFDFVPDPSQAQLFEDANKAVGIIAPPDMPGCTPSELGEFHLGVSAATCSGANVTVPPLGTEVEIVGAYVFDRELEAPVIAPVWAVKPASRAPG